MLKQIFYNDQPTTYYISSDGKLYNEKTDTWYQGRISPSGYLDYNLKLEGQEKSFRAHRLVAEYFLEKPDGCDIVNHKDGNKLNNNVENLEWVTQSENTQHAYDNNLTSRGKTIQFFKGDLEGEEWRPLSFFNDNYLISNFGRVRNLKMNRILTGKRDTGYVRYELRGQNSERKTFLGHRLVYKAFNPDFDINDRNRIINHINGDKFDNRLENLEEMSISENMQHAYRTGLNPKAKVVLQYDENMNLIQEFPSSCEAARQLGISQGLISGACKRKGKSHGFNWRYKDEE